MLRFTAAIRRLRQSFVWLLISMLVGAACSPAAEDTAISDPPPSPPSTTLAGVPGSEAPSGTEVSTSTTSISVPLVVPSYLVYGWEGVTRVHDQGSERHVAEPVRWATEDGAGGIVFWSVAEQPGRAWLPAGADRPTEIPNGFFFLLDGRPTAMVSRSFDDMTQCENEEFMEELSIRDLATGDERFFMCHPSSSDAAEKITSFGGGLFTAVQWWWLIGSGTSGLRFYDLSGQEVTVEHNPFAESCHPCRMHALLSPDGALLAYSLWPTALTGLPEPFDGDYTRAHREWRTQQQDIPTQVVVMDMATGVEIFRTDVVADAELTGFDGRIVEVTTGTGRELFDIETAEGFNAPPALTAPAPFWTVMLASLDNTTMDYDAAQLVASDLAAQHAVETGVLWSDGFVTLNPGLWAVFTGHFATQEGADAYCAALDTGCYSRYVATAGTIDPELGRKMLILEGDGLGLVRFGDIEYDVLALMEKVLGSPPSDLGAEAGFVEYVGWSDFGLFLGFSRPQATEYDGIGRFVGWQYSGTDQLDLTTILGVKPGTTTEELRAIYGDALVVSTGPDACMTGSTQVSALLPDHDTGIVAFLDDAGAVTRLFAGWQTGC